MAAIPVVPRFDAVIFDGANGDQVVADLTAANVPGLPPWTKIDETTDVLVIEGNVGGPDDVRYEIEAGGAAVFQEYAQNMMLVFTAAEFTHRYRSVI